MDARRIIGICVLICMVHSVTAQSDDWGIWSSLSIRKKLTKEWNLTTEAEYRTRDGLSATERWAGTLSLAYKPTFWLKADAGYTYIYGTAPSEVTQKGNIVPQYWYSRHRVTASLTGSFDWGRFTFSLRERWQYTYRPSLLVPKYDGNNGNRKADEKIKTKCKNVLRSRIQTEYNIAMCSVTPFASVECYHGSDGLEKTRWTVGAEYKINKKNAVEIYYRYQNKNDDDEQNGHILGISCIHKF